MARKPRKKPAQARTEPELDDAAIEASPGVELSPADEIIAEGKTPLASGGEKRGEPLTPFEEQDDFEDGRSSGGVQSRAENDRWGRGEEASRLTDARTGPLSVDDPGTLETSAPPTVPRALRRSPGEAPPTDPAVLHPKRRAAKKRAAVRRKPKARAKSKGRRAR
jgi:hypothetical protein